VVVATLMAVVVASVGEGLEFAAAALAASAAVNREVIKCILNQDKLFSAMKNKFGFYICCFK